MRCRNCAKDLYVYEKSWAPVAPEYFVDLGHQPLANSYLTERDLKKPETVYPLKPVICPHCKLIQIPDDIAVADIFGDYAYFSGQSDHWRRHCSRLATEVASGLSVDSRILEIASNDGTLLGQFRRLGFKHIVGVEPAKNIAIRAQLSGIPTIQRFFGESLALEMLAAGYHADIVIGQNVLAHVPSLDDFMEGVELILAPGGTIIFEVPDTEETIAAGAFDQVYQEHLSYFTAASLTSVLELRGFGVQGIERIDTHGGSLRVWANMEKSSYHTKPDDIDHLASMQDAPAEFKRAFVRQLISLKDNGYSIYGYGAAAKGNVCLNYCGVGPDLIEGIFDSTPTKQGRYTPGTHIPILSPERFDEYPTDVVVILAHNWASEIAAKLRDSGYGGLILSRTATIP